jgi:hypothetical protein
MGARPSWSGLGPELEVLAFRVGIKPALRVLVPDTRVHALQRSTQGRSAGGLTIVDAVYASGTAVLYVARDGARAEALRAAEAPILPSAPRRSPEAEVLAAHRELGRLLGYPRCCVEAFVERLARGVDVRRDGTRAAESVVAAEDALAASTEVLARLNVLAPRSLVPFAPCRFDCALALRYADALFAALREHRPDDARALEAQLTIPVRVDARGARLEARDPAPAALELRFSRW